MDATVRHEFELLVPRFERDVGEGLIELQQRYARIERILEQVQVVAEDVFGAKASDVLPETGLRTASRFNFKLTDVEHALDIIVGFGRGVTPGGLGRRLVIRNAEQRLIEMTDRHAGRLRSELARRLTESLWDYRRDLADTVEEAIAAIQDAIERARDERSQGEEGARDRLRELAEIAQRCQQLADGFDQLSATPPPDARPTPPAAATPQ